MVESTEKAVAYYHSIKSIFNDASMNMCKWASTDNIVMEKINAEDKCTDEELKVLGLFESEPKIQKAS